jgi:hypothetical protein
MNVSRIEFRGRAGWELDNDVLKLVMLQGGGHIASLTHSVKPKVNPLWQPIWKPIDPWKYKTAMAKKYESKQLSSVCGHNLCLGSFGNPSPEEKQAGMECHGETGVVRWKLISKKSVKDKVSLTCGCELPVAQMKFVRTISADRFSNMIHVREEVKSTAKRDLPFTMSQHVTLGPPFLKKGVTIFDMPATKCHTYPNDLGGRPRLKGNTAFIWPDGPGAKGEEVNMRMIAAKYRSSSDFSAHLMDRKKKDGWFSALNPEMGVLVAYVWNREDYPWVGNWEENFGRKDKPWAGKSLTRGMEFANTPFPMSLRDQVDMGKFHGLPTFRWLPAKGKIVTEYDVVMAPVIGKVKGVADIQRSGLGLDIALMT